MGFNLKQRLQDLRTDFEEVTGKSFSFFYCTSLFCDEDVKLCGAHIVNKAFANVARDRTVQRSDLDNFYGAYFESEFIDIQYLSSISAGSIADRNLPKSFRAQILRKGKSVGYYSQDSTSTSPPTHTRAQIETEIGTVALNLKLTKAEVEETNDDDWEIRIEKDIRLSALVSLLKGAHLTLFKMLGYRYALSVGGRFMGKDILGDFFAKNKNLGKEEVVQNGLIHFREFSNLVRPVISNNPHIKGTTTDNQLFICKTICDVPWAFVIFIRTTGALHAVLVPIFERPDGIARFLSFLKSDGGTLIAHHCKYEDKVFKVSNKEHSFSWPAGSALKSGV